MMHTHLLEGVSSGVIDPELLQRLVAEALAVDPDNHIKMQTITNRKYSIAEVRPGVRPKTSYLCDRINFGSSRFQGSDLP
jgi:hypothetical protein